MSRADRADVADLIRLQGKLAAQVVEYDDFDWPPKRIAAVDAAFPGRGDCIRAAAVLVAFPSLEILAEQAVERQVTLPYIPGLLSFRELPAMLDALTGLPEPPEVVLCDGQGRAHPRRFGIACHLGVETGLPAVGVAKSRLCGQFNEPGPEKGSRSPLEDRGEAVGMVVRTRDRVRPLFVSVGHRMGLDTAVRLVVETTTRFRLPEPIRAADRLAGGASD